MPTPFSDATGGSARAPEIHTYPAAISFVVTREGEEEGGGGKEYTYSLAHDVTFVTAHPCVPSQHVKIFKSPSSPTIQQIDVTGAAGLGGRSSSPVYLTGKPPKLYLLLVKFCS